MTKKTNSKNSQIIINVDSREEVRAALLENGRLEAFQIETTGTSQTRGNIYKGRITNIEPSLQAAFVDIGLNRNAYLPLDEIHPDYYGYEKDQSKVISLIPKGTEVLVQIAKEETPLKGPSVTTYLSIPGRYLVLMPGSDQLGVSRKVEDEEERKRLKDILSEAKRPEGVGLIARTAGVGIAKAEIKKDLSYLIRFWNILKKKAQSASTPSLIYHDRELITRFLRDHLNTDVTEILVDDQTAFSAIKNFLHIISPKQVSCLTLYKGEVPIFSHYGIEAQLESIFHKKVELPAGGYIFIEPTEALVSIDVNSGKNIREKDIEDTALKTNLEAAEEIARHLRFRDLGGIIVVDFIDMRSNAYRQRVEKHMKECLKKDKARSEISRISKFGLMEIVRQKIGSPLQVTSFMTCPCCNGRGILRSTESLAPACIRRIREVLSTAKKRGAKAIAALTIDAHPHLALYLLNNKRTELCSIETEYQVHIVVNGDSSVEVDSFQISTTYEESPQEGKKEFKGGQR